MKWFIYSVKNLLNLYIVDKLKLVRHRTVNNVRFY